MMRGPLWGTEDAGETWSVWAPSPADPLTNDRAAWAMLDGEGRLVVGVYRNGSEDAYDLRTTAPVVAVARESAPPAASGASLRVEPNPASGAARVRLTLASAETEVRVSVFDARGREVAVVASGALASGEHALAVDTSALASGVYVVRAVVGDRAESARFSVVR